MGAPVGASCHEEVILPFKKTETYDGRSKADFMALRERVGLKQTDVASLLDVNLSTVKRWEKIGYMEPPADAWGLLDGYMALQCEAVSVALAQVAQIVEDQGAEPREVVMTYFRTQKEYDEHGRDEGLFGPVNAKTRAVGAALEDRGIKVSYRYPGDGAISTKDSRY